MSMAPFDNAMSVQMSTSNNGVFVKALCLHMASSLSSMISNVVENPVDLFMLNKVQLMQHFVNSFALYDFCLMILSHLLGKTWLVHQSSRLLWIDVRTSYTMYPSSNNTDWHRLTCLFVNRSYTELFRQTECGTISYNSTVEPYYSTFASLCITLPIFNTFQL